MLGAVRSESMYARDGHGTSPLWSDAMIVVMPWKRKFSARGRSWMLVEMWRVMIHEARRHHEPGGIQARHAACRKAVPRPVRSGLR
jgi:hypothetical protein